MGPRMQYMNNDRNAGYNANNNDNTNDNANDNEDGYADEDVLQAYRERNSMHKPPCVSSISAPSSFTTMSHSRRQRKTAGKSHEEVTVEKVAEEVAEEEEEEGEPAPTISAIWVTPDDLSLRYYQPMTRAALKKSKLLLRASIITKNAFPETDPANSNTNMAAHILTQVLEEARKTTRGAITQEGKQPKQLRLEYTS